MNSFSIQLGYCSEGPDRDRSMSIESTALKSKPGQGHRIGNEQFNFIEDGTTWITESVDETPEDSQNHKNAESNIPNKTTVEISVHQETPTTPPAHGFPSTTIITTSSSVDTLSGHDVIVLNTLSGPPSPSNLSSRTLVGSTGSASNENDKDIKGSREFIYSQAPTSPLPERKHKPTSNVTTSKTQTNENGFKMTDASTQKPPDTDDTMKNVKISETVTVSSKPKIISALTKMAAKDDKGRSSLQSTPSKTSSNVLQPISYLTMNRRPSAGTIGIPSAALSQHRRSLQLNSSEGGFGMSKVNAFNSFMLLRL